MKWEEISLKKYKEILSIIDANLDDVKKSALFVKIIFGEELEDIPILKMHSRLKEVEELLNSPQPVANIKTSYILNNKKYKLVKAKDMNFAAFMDFNELCKNNEDLDVVMERILACFLIPDSAETYNKNYDLEEAIEDILSISVIDSNAIANFILGQLKKSRKIIVLSSIAQILKTKELNWKMKKLMIKTVLRASQILDSSIY